MTVLDVLTAPAEATTYADRVRAWAESVVLTLSQANVNLEQERS